MRVIRDAEGKVINIGEWDFVIVDTENGNHKKIPTVTNPLPLGSVVSDEEVVTGWDNGLYTLDDPRAKG